MTDFIIIELQTTNTVVVSSPGPQGIPGPGIPAGGTTGQGLIKNSGTSYDTSWGVPGLDIASAWTKQQYHPLSTLSINAGFTIDWNWNTQPEASVTLAHDQTYTLNLPSNRQPGVKTLRVYQDSLGNGLLQFNASYLIDTSLTTLTFAADTFIDFYFKDDGYFITVFGAEYENRNIMTVQHPYVACIPQGNTALELIYVSGTGYLIVHRTGNGLVECWGAGGRGGDPGILGEPAGAWVGGGGGGGGAYAFKTLSASRGSVFKWEITPSGDSKFYFKPTLAMTAAHGEDGGIGVGGNGGLASGGNRNFNGKNGFSTETTVGANGGAPISGGSGGAGGALNTNGAPGDDPGGGGGGGGATTGTGGAGGIAKIRITWS